ncbi:MAG: nucleotide exchange factor GrpE [Eubacterium sp.]|nr:nucleotide exchange factor GrpE [Eubacterium sp.]
MAEKEKKETDLDVNAEESSAEVTEENKAEGTDAVDTEQEADTAEPENAEEAVQEETSGDPRDKKIADLTDRLQRQMAEFENFRRRSDKEKAGMYDMGAADVITKVLDVVDNFERGLKDFDETDPFADGMNKIYRQLTKVLDDLGVKEIEAEGKEFDPNFHNAVMHEENPEVGESTITAVFQKGYTYKESVIRHSMVRVAN